MVLKPAGHCAAAPLELIIEPGPGLTCNGFGLGCWCGIHAKRWPPEFSFNAPGVLPRQRESFEQLCKLIHLLQAGYDVNAERPWFEALCR